MCKHDRHMTFKDSLKTKEFVVTAHVNLAQVPDAGSLLRQAAVQGPAVDAVQLIENTGTQPHMSGIAAAALGIDPVVQFICRDRNRIALQRDLLGAAAIGVSSVLVTRGKKIVKGKELGIRNVYDISAKHFMTYIQNLKLAETASLGADFLVGTNAVIFDADTEWAPTNLLQKCDAGANFIQLQLCFDMDVLRNYMAHMVASRITRRVSFITALSPLPSAEVARWVQENVKAALVPQHIIERLENAPDEESEGIEICAELMREVAAIPGVSVGKLSGLIPAGSRHA